MSLKVKPLLPELDRRNIPTRIIFALGTPVSIDTRIVFPSCGSGTVEKTCPLYCPMSTETSGLGSEHLLQRIKNGVACFAWGLGQFSNKSSLIDGSDLINGRHAFGSLDGGCDPKRIGSTSCQRNDNDRV